LDALNEAVVVGTLDSSLSPGGNCFPMFATEDWSAQRAKIADFFAVFSLLFVLMKDGIEDYYE
jgi:hypothetical protein